MSAVRTRAEVSSCGVFSVSDHHQKPVVFVDHGKLCASLVRDEFVRTGALLSNLAPGSNRLVTLSPVQPSVRPAYPDTRKVDHVDTYHGTEVADPYRWLEGESPEIDRWVDAQNDLTQSVLDKVYLNAKELKIG